MDQLMEFDFPINLLDTIIVVACFWIAAKQYECRRNIPMAKSLAQVVRILPKQLANVEMNIMNALDWQVVF